MNRSSSIATTPDNANIEPLSSSGPKGNKNGGSCLKAGAILAIAGILAGPVLVVLTQFNNGAKPNDVNTALDLKSAEITETPTNLRGRGLEFPQAQQDSWEKFIVRSPSVADSFENESLDDIKKDPAQFSDEKPTSCSSESPEPTKTPIDDPKPAFECILLLKLKWAFVFVLCCAAFASGEFNFDHVDNKIQNSLLRGGFSGLFSSILNAFIGVHLKRVISNGKKDTCNLEVMLNTFSVSLPASFVNHLVLEFLITTLGESIAKKYGKIASSIACGGAQTIITFFLAAEKAAVREGKTVCGLFSSGGLIQVFCMQWGFGVCTFMLRIFLEELFIKCTALVEPDAIEDVAVPEKKSEKKKLNALGYFCLLLSTNALLTPYQFVLTLGMAGKSCFEWNCPMSMTADGMDFWYDRSRIQEKGAVQVDQGIWDLITEENKLKRNFVNASFEAVQDFVVPEKCIVSVKKGMILFEDKNGSGRLKRLSSEPTTFEGLAFGFPVEESCFRTVGKKVGCNLLQGLLKAMAYFAAVFMLGMGGKKNWLYGAFLAIAALAVYLLVFEVGGRYCLLALKI